MDKIRAIVARIKYDNYNIGISAQGGDTFACGAMLHSPRGIEYQGTEAGLLEYLVGFEKGLADGSIMPQEKLVWKPMLQ